MGIAALATGMKMQSVSLQVSMSATKRAMNVVEQQMQGFVEMMQTATPSFGHALDMKV